MRTKQMLYVYMYKTDVVCIYVQTRCCMYICTNQMLYVYMYKPDVVCIYE